MIAGHFRKVKNMKRYRHFGLARSSPGVVSVQLASDTEEESIVLADQDWEPASCSLPRLNPPVVYHTKGKCTCTTQFGSTAPMKSVFVCVQGLSLLSQPPMVQLPHVPRAFPHPPLPVAIYQQRSYACAKTARSCGRKSSDE